MTVRKTTAAATRAIVGQPFMMGLLLTAGVSAGAAAEPTSAAADPTVEALLQRIEALEQRLQELEAQQQSPPSSQRREPHWRVVEEDLTPGTDTASALLVEGQAVPGSERAPAETDEPADLDIHIGGALRYNLVHRGGSSDSRDKRGETGLDVFRLNIDGQIDSILISAEYRYYSYMDTLHHGWLGYEFENGSQLQMGIHQVPFGLLPYAAHNAWFGVPYYTGFADNYDMGLKYIHSSGPWNLHLAFYKNEELNNPFSSDRYAYDLIREGDQQNEEINRLNTRLAYTLGQGTTCENEVGLSVQAAQVYNAGTRRRGDHRAGAVHLDSHCGRWNFQLQGIHYEYDLANPAGIDRRLVRVGAFADTFDIPARASILTANVAYNFEPFWEWMDSFTCYNNYSQLFKSLDDSRDSKINTLGCSVGVGPLFTYVDYILGNNMIYFGDGSLARGGEDRWRHRLNINVGFYW